MEIWTNMENTNISLKIIHGEEQEEYCRWKASLFDCKVTYIKHNGYAQKPAYSFQTKLFYFPHKIGKKTSVDKSIIDQMDDLALAIWYMDDGSLNEEVATFHTESFDEDTVDHLINKLETFEITCSKQLSKNKYWIIWVNTAGTKRLLERIYPYVCKIKCMNYKTQSLEMRMSMEDLNKNINSVFWRKDYVPIGKRYTNLVITAYVNYNRSKTNKYKWKKCKKCKKNAWHSLVPVENRDDYWRCSHISLPERVHFSLSNYINITGCKYLDYGVVPVLSVKLCDKKHDNVYDIEVAETIIIWS